MDKRYVLLATGGTIASVDSENGLRPALHAEDILQRIVLPVHVKMTGYDVFSLDSSNIQPEEWCVLARAVAAALETADGVVITHGTDTLAYTAAALSYMLAGLQKPVVLTGSQLPLAHPLSDAQANFLEAVTVLDAACPGVYISFHHKVILGTHAVKMRTTAFDAFHSVNAALAGVADADGVHMRVQAPPDIRTENALCDELEPRVFLLKLIPGTAPEVFDFIVQAGYRGLVIEAFGLGGLHYIRRNLVDKLCALGDQGITTLVITQCMYERADFTLYEVGKNVLSKSVYSGRDMTAEAAVTKLMWVLGKPEERMQYLEQSICGEFGAG